MSNIVLQVLLGGSYYMDLIIIVVLTFLVIRFLRKRMKPDIHANWNQLLDNFKYDTSEFYMLLGQKIKEFNIEGVSMSAVIHKEGNALSSSRKYCRIEWKRLSFDCCLAPFGRGTFVSWWLFSPRSIREVIISTLPFGESILRAWRPKTFYGYDNASMFRTNIQAAVLEVIDDITKDSGIRLSEADRKPILNDFFKR